MDAWHDLACGKHQSEIDEKDVADDDERQGKDDPVELQIQLSVGDGKAGEDDMVCV